jgi:hypothetical protein
MFQILELELEIMELEPRNQNQVPFLPPKKKKTPQNQNQTDPSENVRNQKGEFFLEWGTSGPLLLT